MRENQNDGGTRSQKCLAVVIQYMSVTDGQKDKQIEYC